MKKSLLSLTFVALALVLAVSVAVTGCAKKEDVIIEELEAKGGAKGISNASFKPFDIYTDKRSPNNHYIASGWMGDYSDIKYNDMWLENPHSGTTCVRVEHLARRSQGAGWIGVYWQNPAKNWGSKRAGFDLTGAKRIAFWARGEKGGEVVSEFKMGGITGEFSDSASAGIGPAILSSEWKKFEIDLTGQDLSHVIGGFCLSISADDNAGPITIYLDDMRYE